ncbi:hypothetical protein G6L68_25520 [Agrobacterium fabrum]|uniref:hypothetical protein n=1 Tax=Agrobacterium fabrum TaxID=1176649 RepID=UPI000EF568CD|nr:hypothetical protein [Agrobacterium fabrum]AYM66147.1 hypothetical protein At12D13_49950 [Agrobacterium fabrum]NTE63995.1 hypothetical protein [Agrobacterium fabrum]
MPKTIFSLPLTQKEAIQLLVETVNGAATTWTASTDDIIAVGKEIEQLRIDTKLPRGLSFGMEAAFTTGGPSDSYRAKAHSVIGSSVIYRYGRDGWRLTSVTRATVYAGQKREIKLVVSAKQADEIKARSIADLIVRKAA